MRNEIDRILEALSYVDVNIRDTWIRMGMAVHSEFGDAGFEIWDEWSRQGASYSARDARSVWKGFRSNGSVTLGSLIHEAKANGWRDGGDHCSLSQEMLDERKRTAEARVRQEEAAVNRERDETAQHAKDVWQRAKPVRKDHPYLLRKQVQPTTTLREIDAGALVDILHYTPKSRGEVLVGRLLVVPVKQEGRLSTLELIDAEGRKTALKGRGSKAGGYWATQPLSGAPDALLIGEGVATVLSVKEATGYPGIASLSSSNLVSLARTMRDHFPDTQVVLLADLEKGSGLPDAHAIEAAEAIGGLIAAPDFGGLREEGFTDFNDMSKECGHDAVKKVIELALEKGHVSDVNDLTRSSFEQWPEPAPLPDELPTVETFDEALLPEALRPRVSDIAHRMQCPPDFPAVAMVTALSSLIGARALIAPKERDDWQATPNLWGMVVGRPGVKKSPALSEAMKPLLQLEEEARHSWESQRKEWEIDCQLSEMKSKQNLKDAASELNKDEFMARKLLGKEEAPEEPTRRRYVVNDSSVEKLADILTTNEWGVLVFRDEIHGLLRSMDKQGQEGGRGFYLTGHDGNQGYAVDRIGRGESYVSRVCIAMLGGIQPSKLQAYVREAVSGGASDDGLLQRFGLAVWPDESKTYTHVDQAPDLDAKQRAQNVFQRLNGLLGEDESPLSWHFSPDAQALFNEWLVSLENDLRGDALHPALISHLAKYRKLIPALALIFALVDTPESPGLVNEKELLRALAWSDYLRLHAERIYAAAVSPETAGAKALMDKIKSGKLRDGAGRKLKSFKPRQVAVKHWAGLCRPEEVRKAAELLEEYGWLERRNVSHGPKGGRPSHEYVIHPRLLEEVDHG